MRTRSNGGREKNHRKQLVAKHPSSRAAERRKQGDEQ
jgi:hypothetical protein